MSDVILSTVTLEDFNDLVEKEFVPMMDMVEPQARDLFIFDDIRDHTSPFKRYDEIDVETFAKRKREGQNTASAKVQKGYNVTGQIKRYGLEIDITYEDRKYNKYPEVTSKLTDLGHFCPQRMELDLTHILTYADATSYVNLDGDTVDLRVGDGLALLSSVHTLRGSSATYSNILTGNPQFSEGAVEAAEQLAATNIVSHFNEKRRMNFDTIITTDDPATINDVKRFLRSTAQVGQNNPGVVNVYAEKYRHVVLPYLATDANGNNDSSKRKRWFLAACNGSPGQRWQAYLGVNEAPRLISPAEGNNLEDAHKDVWTYGTRCGYLIVVLTGRGCIGSLGDGS